MKHFISGLVKFIATLGLVATLFACGGADERKTVYLEKGKTYLEDRNYDKARIEFKNVLQIDPKFAEAFYYMGQLEERTKEIRKAVGNYKKAIQLDPLHNLAKIKLAKIYVIVGTPELTSEAETLLSEVKKQDPENSEADLVLATIKYKNGSKEQAIKIVKSVVNKDIKLIEAVTLLANMYIDQKKYEQATAILLKASKSNPKDIILKTSLAELFANDLDDLVKAEKYLLEALQLEPDNSKLQMALASFYGRTKQTDKAEVILRKMIKQDDEDFQRYVYLVELLALHKGLNQADQALLDAIKNKPDLYELKFFQARFYYKFGKKKRAKEILNKIIDDRVYDKEGVEARTLLASYLLEEGDRISAKKHVDAVLAEHPNDSNALFIASKLVLANLDAISAINNLRTVVKNSPGNVDATLLLAQAYVLNGQSDLAENELKKSIEANPIADKAHANYARFLATNGRVDEALILIDKALTYFKASYDLMDVKLKIIASQGKEAEAVELLDLMEKALPSRFEVNMAKGKYSFAKRDYAESVKQFEKAYTKANQKYDPLKAIIKAYLVNKQIDKAYDRLQLLLDKDPESAIANQLYGQVNVLDKKIEEARSRFKRASKSAESWFPPYASLAATYLVEKNTDKAIEIYQTAISRLRNKAPAQMRLAAIFESQKDYPKAMDIYKQVLAENPAQKLAANNLASLLLDYGSDADAVKALELVKGFDKIRQPALLDTLGWAYAKTGDSAKAVEILKPVVEKAPKIAVFRYHFGYALYYMGDKAAAKSHLEIASNSEQQFPGKDNALKLFKSI